MTAAPGAGHARFFSNHGNAVIRSTVQDHLELTASELHEAAETLPYGDEQDGRLHRAGRMKAASQVIKQTAVIPGLEGAELRPPQLESGGYRHIAGPAMEVGAVFCFHDLEALWHGHNSWRLVAFGLAQAG